MSVFIAKLSQKVRQLPSAVFRLEEGGSEKKKDVLKQETIRMPGYRAGRLL